MSAEAERDWDIVNEAFYSGCDECKECEYWYYEYYTDIGEYTSCSLLEMDGGNPKFCRAYDRLFEEMSNE